LMLAKYTVVLGRQSISPRCHFDAMQMTCDLLAPDNLPLAQAAASRLTRPVRPARIRPQRSGDIRSLVPSEGPCPCPPWPRSGDLPRLARPALSMGLQISMYEVMYVHTRRGPRGGRADGRPAQLSSDQPHRNAMAMANPVSDGPMTTAKAKRSGASVLVSSCLPSHASTGAGHRATAKRASLSPGPPSSKPNRVPI
jgi:hypothetical protein